MKAPAKKRRSRTVGQKLGEFKGKKRNRAEVGFFIKDAQEDRDMGRKQKTHVQHIKVACL